MQNILRALRFVVYGAFVVCNAIIASVAVWNLSFSQSVSWISQIDSYLTFLGASGLALIFTIVFLELARNNSFTGRLWFECLWVSLWWIMNLAGAAALSALGIGKMCHQEVGPQQHARCSSAFVLMAFTWTLTAILLIYLCTLVISGLLYQQRNPDIWREHIHNLPRSDSRRLINTPASPLPQFLKKGPSIVAPKPRRVIPPPAALYAEYQIEHYNPPGNANYRPVPPVPAAAPPHHVMQTTRQASSNMPVSSFYPQYMQTILPQPAQTLPQQPRPPSPSPLGDWPRADVMSQPRYKRRQPRLSIDTSGNMISPSRSRPSGPRRRSVSSSEGAGLVGPVGHNAIRVISTR